MSDEAAPFPWREGKRWDFGFNDCEPALAYSREMKVLFNYSHIKYRNMFLQIILVIITLGIYGIYWFHVTLGEMHRANSRGPEVGRWKWTILFCIPFMDFFSFWHYSGEYTEFVREKYPRILIFILWIVFLPAVWFLVQRDLNRAAGIQYMG